MAKTRAIPSLHRDPSRSLSRKAGLRTLWLKNQPRPEYSGRDARMLSSGNSHRRILAPRYPDPE